MNQKQILQLQKDATNPDVIKLFELLRDYMKTRWLGEYELELDDCNLYIEYEPFGIDFESEI